MAGNPLVAQGSLNRILGSIVIPSFPGLNITAPYLGKAGISLALNGDAALVLPTMTGTAISEEPYMIVSVSVNLLRTQAFADSWKLQMENDSAIGNITIRPDSRVLGNYPIYNAVITGVRELSFAGQDPGYMITLGGYYLTNAALWS